MAIDACNHGHSGCCTGGCRRGVSSFFIHDGERVLGSLGLKTGDSFLDLGCGAGDYSIRASSIVGESGKIFALDRNGAAIDDLNGLIERMGLENVTAGIADVTRKIPVESGCVDLCLLSTVLHIPDVADRASELGAEIRRVLRPGGRLAVIEVNGGDGFFGPARHVKISPQEVEKLLSPCGFRQSNMFDFGRSYMLLFDIS